MRDPDMTRLPLRKLVNHTTSYLRMKADAARRFLATMMTLAIATIPTWRTQHESYISWRLQLLTRLDQETILAALIEDHNSRHPTRILTYHDARYFMMFELAPSDRPPDATAGTTTPSASSQPRASNGQFTRRTGRERSTSDPTNSPATGDAEEKFDDSDLNSRFDDMKLNMSITSHGANSAPPALDSVILELAGHGKRALKIAFGTRFDVRTGKPKRNFILDEFDRVGIDYQQDPLLGVIHLDNTLLSGEHWSIDDENKLRDNYWKYSLRLHDRIGDYWYESEQRCLQLTSIPGSSVTPKQKWDKFWTELRDVRTTEHKKGKPDPYHYLADDLASCDKTYRRTYNRTVTQPQLDQFVSDLVEEENAQHPVPRLSQEKPRWHQGGSRNRWTKETLLELNEEDRTEILINELLMAFQSRSEAPRLSGFLADPSAKPGPHEERKGKKSPFQQRVARKPTTGLKTTMGLKKKDGCPTRLSVWKKVAPPRNWDHSIRCCDCGGKSLENCPRKDSPANNEYAKSRQPGSKNWGKVPKPTSPPWVKKSATTAGQENFLQLSEEPTIELESDSTENNDTLLPDAEVSTNQQFNVNETILMLREYYSPALSAAEAQSELILLHSLPEDPLTDEETPSVDIGNISFQNLNPFAPIDLPPPSDQLSTLHHDIDASAVGGKLVDGEVTDQDPFGNHFSISLTESNIDKSRETEPEESSPLLGKSFQTTLDFDKGSLTDIWEADRLAKKHVFYLGEKVTYQMQTSYLGSWFTGTFNVSAVLTRQLTGGYWKVHSIDYGMCTVHESKLKADHRLSSTAPTCCPKKKARRKCWSKWVNTLGGWVALCVLSPMLLCLLVFMAHGVSSVSSVLSNHVPQAYHLFPNNYGVNNATTRGFKEKLSKFPPLSIAHQLSHPTVSADTMMLVHRHIDQMANDTVLKSRKTRMTVQGMPVNYHTHVSVPADDDATDDDELTDRAKSGDVPEKVDRHQNADPDIHGPVQLPVADLRDALKTEKQSRPIWWLQRITELVGSNAMVHSGALVVKLKDGLSKENETEHVLLRGGENQSHTELRLMAERKTTADKYWIPMFCTVIAATLAMMMVPSTAEFKFKIPPGQIRSFRPKDCERLSERDIKDLNHAKAQIFEQGLPFKRYASHFCDSAHDAKLKLITTYRALNALSTSQPSVPTQSIAVTDDLDVFYDIDPYTRTLRDLAGVLYKRRDIASKGLPYRRNFYLILDEDGPADGRVCEHPQPMRLGRQIVGPALTAEKAAQFREGKVRHLIHQRRKRTRAQNKFRQCSENNCPHPATSTRHALCTKHKLAVKYGLGREILDRVWSKIPSSRKCLSPNCDLLCDDGDDFCHQRCGAKHASAQSEMNRRLPIANTDMKYHLLFCNGTWRSDIDNADAVIVRGLPANIQHNCMDDHKLQSTDTDRQHLLDYTSHHSIVLSSETGSVLDDKSYHFNAVMPPWHHFFRPGWMHGDGSIHEPNPATGSTDETKKLPTMDGEMFKNNSASMYPTVSAAYQLGWVSLSPAGPSSAEWLEQYSRLHKRQAVPAVYQSSHPSAVEAEQGWASENFKQWLLCHVDNLWATNDHSKSSSGTALMTLARAREAVAFIVDYHQALQTNRHRKQTISGNANASSSVQWSGSTAQYLLYSILKCISLQDLDRLECLLNVIAGSKNELHEAYVVNQLPPETLRRRALLSRGTKHKREQSRYIQGYQTEHTSVNRSYGSVGVTSKLPNKLGRWDTGQGKHTGLSKKKGKRTGQLRKGKHPKRNFDAASEHWPQLTVTPNSVPQKALPVMGASSEVKLSPGDPVMITNAGDSSSVEKAIVASVDEDGVELLRTGTQTPLRTTNASVNAVASLTIHDSPYSGDYGPLFMKLVTVHPQDRPRPYIADSDDPHRHSFFIESPEIVLAKLDIYMPDGTEGLSNLFVSDKTTMSSMLTPTILACYDIGTVISLVTNAGARSPGRCGRADGKDVNHVTIKVKDTSEADDSSNRRQIAKVVNELAVATVKGHRIVIHCTSGKRRAVACVVEFLNRLMPLSHLLPQVTSQVPWLTMNDAFIRNFVQYDREHHNTRHATAHCQRSIRPMSERQIAEEMTVSFAGQTDTALDTIFETLPKRLQNELTDNVAPGDSFPTSNQPQWNPTVPLLTALLVYSSIVANMNSWKVCLSEVSLSQWIPLVELNYKGAHTFDYILLNCTQLCVCIMQVDMDKIKAVCAWSIVQNLVFFRQYLHLALSVDLEPDRSSEFKYPIWSTVLHRIRQAVSTIWLHLRPPTHPGSQEEIRHSESGEAEKAHAGSGEEKTEDPARTLSPIHSTMWWSRAKFIQSPEKITLDLKLNNSTQSDYSETEMSQQSTPSPTAVKELSEAINRAKAGLPHPDAPRTPSSSPTPGAGAVEVRWGLDRQQQLDSHRSRLARDDSSSNQKLKRKVIASKSEMASRYNDIANMKRDRESKELAKMLCSDENGSHIATPERHTVQDLEDCCNERLACFTEHFQCQNCPQPESAEGGIFAMELDESITEDGEAFEMAKAEEASTATSLSPVSTRTRTRVSGALLQGVVVATLPTSGEAMSVGQELTQSPILLALLMIVTAVGVLMLVYLAFNSECKLHCCNNWGNASNLTTGVDVGDSKSEVRARVRCDRKQDRNNPLFDYHPSAPLSANHTANCSYCDAILWSAFGPDLSHSRCGCRDAYYCDDDCRWLDWPEHKNQCEHHQKCKDMANLLKRWKAVDEDTRALEAGPSGVNMNLVTDTATDYAGFYVTHKPLFNRIGLRTFDELKWLLGVLSFHRASIKNLNTRTERLTTLLMVGIKFEYKIEKFYWSQYLQAELDDVLMELSELCTVTHEHVIMVSAVGQSRVTQSDAPTLNADYEETTARNKPAPQHFSLLTPRNRQVDTLEAISSDDETDSPCVKLPFTATDESVQYCSEDQDLLVEQALYAAPNCHAREDWTKRWGAPRSPATMSLAATVDGSSGVMASQPQPLPLSAPSDDPPLSPDPTEDHRQVVVTNTKVQVVAKKKRRRVNGTQHPQQNAAENNNAGARPRPAGGLRILTAGMLLMKLVHGSPVNQSAYPVNMDRWTTDMSLLPPPGREEAYKPLTVAYTTHVSSGQALPQQSSDNKLLETTTVDTEAADYTSPFDIPEGDSWFDRLQVHVSLVWYSSLAAMAVLLMSVFLSNWRDTRAIIVIGIIVCLIFAASTRSLHTGIVEAMANLITILNQLKMTKMSVHVLLAAVVVIAVAIYSALFSFLTKGMSHVRCVSWMKCGLSRLKHNLRRLMAVMLIVYLTCKYNPPTCKADFIGDVTIDLANFTPRPDAPYQLSLPLDPMGPLAMWTRSRLNTEELNVSYTVAHDEPMAKLTATVPGMELALLDSGATSSGTNKRHVLTNTYKDVTVVGGALGKYSVCNTRGDCSFTAYDRKTKKFAKVTMPNTCYIPDLQQDLFSLSKLSHQGLFFSNEFHIMHTPTRTDGSHQSELPFISAQNLYRLPVMYRTSKKLTDEQQRTWRKWGDSKASHKQENFSTLATMESVGWSHQHRPKIAKWYLSDPCPVPSHENGTCIAIIEPRVKVAEAAESAFPSSKISNCKLATLRRDNSALKSMIRDHVNVSVVHACPPSDPFASTGSMQGIKTTDGQELLACVDMLSELPALKYMMITTVCALKTHFPETLALMGEKAVTAGFVMTHKCIDSAHHGSAESCNALYIVFERKTIGENTGGFEFPKADPSSATGTVRSALSATKEAAQSSEISATRKTFPLKPSSEGRSTSQTRPLAMGEVQTDHKVPLQRFYSIDHAAPPLTLDSLFLDSRFDIVRPLNLTEKLAVRQQRHGLYTELGFSADDLAAMISAPNPALQSKLEDRLNKYCVGEMGDRTYFADDNLNWTAEEAHVRLMHCYPGTAKLMGLKSLPFKCKCCSLGCIKRTARPKERIAKLPRRGHKIGIDLLPMSVPSRESGYIILLVAIDYFTHRIFIEPMKSKEDTLEAFKNIRQKMAADADENEMIISQLRGDSDSMFFDRKFDRYCKSVNTIFSSAGPGDQWQSGLVEITNGLLKDKLVTHLIASDRDPDLWLACARWLVYTHNRMPCQANVAGMSPHEAWFNEKPAISHLRGWGCDVVVKKQVHNNLTPKGKEGIFLSYSPSHSLGTYSILMKESGRVVQSRHVEFQEHQLYPTFDTRMNVTPAEEEGSIAAKKYSPLLTSEEDEPSINLKPTTVKKKPKKTARAKPNSLPNRKHEKHTIATLKAETRVFAPGPHIHRMLSNAVEERVHKCIGKTPTECLAVTYHKNKTGQLMKLSFTDMRWDLDHKYMMLTDTSEKIAHVTVKFADSKWSAKPSYENFLFASLDQPKIVENPPPPAPHQAPTTITRVSTFFNSLKDLLVGRKKKRTEPLGKPATREATRKATADLLKIVEHLNATCPVTKERPKDSGRGLYGRDALSGEERSHIVRCLETGLISSFEVQVETPSKSVVIFAVVNDEQMNLVHNVHTDLVEFMGIMSPDEDVPGDLNAVLRHAHRKEWLESVRKEFQTMIDTGALRVVQLRPNQKLLGTKLVLRRKMTADGTMLKSRKARITIQGFGQRPQIDYKRIFAPTCSLVTLRAMCSISNHMDYELVNFDFTAAFTQSFMEENLFCDYPHGLRPPKPQHGKAPDATKQPPQKTVTKKKSDESGCEVGGSGNTHPEDREPDTPQDWTQNAPTCLQIVRSVYGCVQSPRNFNLLVHNWMISHSFRRSSVDSCFYIAEKTVGGTKHKIWCEDKNMWKDKVCGGTTHRLWCLLYVDDVACCYDKTNPIATQMYGEFKTSLLKDFDVEYRGDLTHFLGYKVLRDRANRKLKLTQAASLRTLLKDSGMLETEKKMTPAPADCKPSKKQCPDITTDEGKLEREEMDGKPFASRVGGLLWQARTVRWDIAWITGMLTRFMSCYGKVHWGMSTYVLKFLSSTKDRGLNFAQQMNGLTLRGSCDANHLCDYGDERENMHNTLGWAFLLGGAAISVRSRKAQRPSCSSAESETQALWDCIREAIWLRRMMREFGQEQMDSTVIECDSQIAIRLSEEHCESERSKHWDAEYQLIRSEVGQRESVKIIWMETGRHCSDALTKGLTRSLFEKHTQRLMGEPWIFSDDSTADE